jgi:amino acid adenylation domain-containing protein
MPAALYYTLRYCEQRLHSGGEYRAMSESNVNGGPQRLAAAGSGLRVEKEPVAIVGIGCRFPGRANDPDSFWKLLEDGVDAITEVPGRRWNTKTFYDPEIGKPGKTHAHWGGFIEGIDQFDPHFFGISPREASRMDPQQRLLLEVAWEALEDGGQPLERCSGSKTAVFVGISSWDYAMGQTSFRDRAVIDVYTNTGGALSIAANRISYCFNLAGPSAAVDTACSSALVAVHLACQSIWAGGCPLALAGGVNALLLPDWYVGFSRLGMLSPDGRCRAFDARANGFVRSEGAGMVVLKPLAQALADDDRIYAVIRGTAVNQDGRTPGMTVPSQDAQEALLREACRNAGVSPGQIQYVEAHGTGTPVGDPIEVRALGRVLSAGRSANRPCVLGSVKTNIGHLEAGAGMAGLIKTALALYHRRIPGNLHFAHPNPEIDFEHLRLRVPLHSEAWPPSSGGSRPRLAGVNAFGFGGTNAHVVLQSADSGEQQAAAPSSALPPAPTSVLVPLSARSPEALRGAASAWQKFLTDGSDEVSLFDLAGNAALRRSHHDHRLAVVAQSRQDLAEQLAAFAGGEPLPGTASDRAEAGGRSKLAFVCSGQGPQWWAMGRQLLTQEPVFRGVIERCDEIVCRLGPWSLLAELSADETHSRMDETAIAQPALFALQVGLAALWQSWGIHPDAVVGHSVGEVAAAHLAGVFSLADAVRIIYQRGRCMELAPLRGRMLAAGVPLDEARRLSAPYGDRVSIAAVNGPASVTLSGESGPLEEIAEVLELQKVFWRFLRVHYAFHSAQMDPIRDELLASLRGIEPRAATLPLFSTVTARRVTGVELGPEYWWHNVRRTVRFADGVDWLIELGCETVVELSPHPVLKAAVAECQQHRGKKGLVLPSLLRHEEERATLLRSLGCLYTLGHPIDWSVVSPRPHRFIRLPAYSWQKQTCWFEAEECRRTRLAAPTHPLLGLTVEAPRPAWEAGLDLRLFPYLNDHRVQGSAIVPATAYLEMAFAVAREVFGHSACRLEDVKLVNPCFPAQDRALRLHTAYQREDATVQIHSRSTEENPDWTTHFTAVLRAQPPLERGSENGETALIPHSAIPAAVEAIKQRCPRPFSGAQCQAYFEKLGLNYGPLFQGIQRVWQGEREALGEIRRPEGLTAQEDDLFPPALLDACFQVVIAANGAFDTTVAGLYLPAEMDEVRLLGQASERLWSHARLREQTARWCVADLDVYDDTGMLLAQVRGLRSRRVAGGRADGHLDDLLYAYEWQQWKEEGGKKDDTGHWLLFADHTGLGDHVAECLRAGGGSCTVVLPGSAFESCGGDRYQINPGSREDMDRLLQAVGTPPGRGCQGIVHLWNLNAPSAEGASAGDLESAQEAGLLSVLSLVQAWDKTDTPLVPPLLLVTCGAQSVGEQPERTAVGQSPVIGLGRVIINEYPRLRCKLVDLDPLDANRQARARSLLDELRREDDEDELALRGPNRYVHRFVPSSGQSSAATSDQMNGPYRLSTARPGTLDGLTLRAFRRRAPGRGEVEIEVLAAALNFSDVMKALGIYPGLPDGPVPFGAECSGRITVLGEGVDEFQVGEEVLGVAPFAFGSHVTTRAELVALKPGPLSFEEAATIPIAFLTASYALDHLGRLSAGERVLIHSATGGVGLAALQLARRVGAEVFATAGTAEKRAFLTSIGVEHVMDSRSLAFADEVLERTGGQGVDAVLNSLAGEAISRGLATLADYGRFLEIGKRDIYQNTRLGLGPFRKNLSFFAIDLDRLMRERPGLLGSLLGHLVKDVGEGTLSPLPHAVYPISEVAAAFRTMQQGKHIGKLVLSMRQRPPSIAPGDEPVAFRADASYLITGGLGGFGLAVARWMVERGARHLVLVGRRGIHSPEARAGVAALETLGARVTVLTADVSKEEDVTSVLAEVDRSLPPLRGVLHAAMVLEDSLLLNLDRELMRRVIAPKLGGAWNLHTQTANRSLDFFVLFSSLSSVFGHAGQGNYAAGNAFLDALAHHRRAQGLPALTVNWGYLGEVGYLAQRQQLGERLERQGVLSFTVQEALALLEKALQRQAVQVSVMRVDWARWRGLGVTGRVSPRFAHLLQEAQSAISTQAGLPTLAALRAVAPEQRPELLDALLGEKVARLLGANLAKLDRDKPLLNLGLDSLMAVELRNWIESELRVNLPIVELMRSPSIARLTELLLGQLSPTGVGESEPADGLGASAASPSLLLAEPCFPLSQGQRGLWALHHADRTRAVCNICFSSRVLCRLDVAVFRQALQALVDRHPTLRTTFEEHGGELIQRVHEEAAVCLEVRDATSWSEELLRVRLEEEAHRPFDLERGPLLRINLFTRGPEEHVLLLTVHHLGGDLWSLVLLMEDMRHLYPGEDYLPTPLPPRTKTYQDFVRWQTDLLAGPEGERLAAYWERQLAGVSPVLDLPTDRPRPPLFSHRGAALPCRIGADLTRRLKALAASEGVTLYTLLLAGFQVLLGRTSDQEDLLVGSPFAGRNRPEFESIVGYFINLLPLRADLSGDPPFRTLLRQVSATVLDALEHQDYPFGLLVERLKLQRDPSRTPLVQATFVLEKAHSASQVGTWRFFASDAEGRRTVGGLPMEPYPVQLHTGQSDLELVLEDGAGTIEGVLVYNVDLFDADTISRLILHFQTLLESVAVDPARRLSELSWLTDAERRQVVSDWNATEVEYPSDSCLHQLFERQAQRTPTASALRFGGQARSYAELNTWADRLAADLRRRGVGPDTLVALCLERSPEMVAAILATLKAGGAYVPLDPASPPERLHVLLTETRPTVLLTQGHLLPRLPQVETEVLCIDQTESLGANTSTTNGDCALSPCYSEPGNLAYVIYTSGSTGRPKGVMVEHRAICNTVLWRQQAMPVRAEDRVLLVLPYYFDASVCTIFTTLAAGAALILPEPNEERDPLRLLERMGREGVTVLAAAPSLHRLLLDGPLGDAGRALRWVCSGGEAMPVELPARLFALLDVEVYNLYGPTEAAVDVTWWRCRRGELRPIIPIGRPIANVNVYVLDRHRQPVPVGVPGELYIGGAGLARGYLHDAELTAERFLPDPFRAGGGARLYRTGDRCRWLDDGSLEFLGRVDQQVKVRGFRIEVAEVEAGLATAPAVREAAVAVLQDAGEQRMVAYVVAQDAAAPPSAEALRRHLQERLPEYMLPSSYVLLPELPRTATNKLDRRALPAPLSGLLPAGQPYVAPRTPLEQFLADRWSELLQIDRVGIEDDFFHLGGNSLQAAMLIHRLQEDLGQHLYTVALFDSPTVGGLARYMGKACPEAVRRLFGPESLPGEGSRGEELNGFGSDSLSAHLVVTQSPYLVALQPHGSLPPLFMVHPPGGIVLCYQAMGRHLGSDQPLYGIRARGLHGEQGLPTRLEDMAAEYVAAIRAVQPEGPYQLGGWSLGGVVALETAQQLLALGESVGLLVFLDTTIPLGPSNQDYAQEVDRSGREYGLDLTLEQLGQLGPDEQLPYLWQHVQKLGLVEADTPLSLVQQLLDDLKRLFHAHVRLASEYAVRPYPGRITLFRPAEAPVLVATPPDRGWGKLADSVEVHFVPGQHHTMVKEPHVQVLAQVLSGLLAKNGNGPGMQARGTGSLPVRSPKDRQAAPPTGADVTPAGARME